MSGFERRARARVAAGAVAGCIGAAVLCFGPIGTVGALAAPSGPGASTTTTVVPTTTTPAVVSAWGLFSKVNPATATRVEMVP